MTTRVVFFAALGSGIVGLLIEILSANQVLDGLGDVLMGSAAMTVAVLLDRD